MSRSILPSSGSSSSEMQASGGGWWADVTEAFRSLKRRRWPAWIGFRYLRSKKNSRFLSFITVISMIGVALGVTTMVVVLSVMDGFEVELKKRLMQTDLHLMVSPARDHPTGVDGFIPEESFQRSAAFEYLKTRSDVTEVSRIIQTEAILKLGDRTAGVTVKGVPPEKMKELGEKLVESPLSQLRGKMEGGAIQEQPGIYIGQELAYDLGAAPGDEIVLISPIEMEGPLTSVPRMKTFRVDGIYRTGIPEQEMHTLFATDSGVRSFLRKRHVASHWEVTLKRFEDAPALAAEMRKRDSGFLIRDWMQLNTHLFSSLKLERIAMFISLAFIVIVASFNIVTTLTLMVLEKKREISILKAMGARDADVAAIFLAEGLFIGAIGVIGGLIAGLLICIWLKSTQLIQLPEVYYDRRLPVSFLPSYYAAIGIAGVVIVLIACLYPSRRAAKVDPLIGIRYG